MEKIELDHLKHYLGTGLKCQYVGIVDVLKYNKCSFLDPFDSEEETGMGLKIGELKEIKIYKKYWKAYIGTYHAHLKSFINGYGFKLCLTPLSAITELRDEFFILYGGGCAHSKEAKERWKDDFINNILYSPIESINYGIVQKLIEQHFDVFGLIDAGLAIDKRLQ